MIAGTQAISRALVAWVGVVLGWPVTTILVVLALAAGSLHYAGGRLGINTDTANMISPELPWRRDFIAYRDSFEIRDRNIVVVVDGDTQSAADGYAERLAQRLRDEPELFQSVFLAGSGEFFERNGLLFLSLPELEALSDRLVDAQPVLGLLERRFNGAGVVSVAERVAAAGADGPTAPPDELGALYEELARSLEASAEGRRDPVAWRSLLGGAAEEAGRSLVLLRPKLDFDRIQPGAEAIERIRALVDELGDASVDVRLTGTVAMEHEELVSVTRGATVAGVAALALVTLVLYWALRSIVLMAVSLVTLLVGLAFTAAFAGFAVGHLNLISVAFAVLYIGLGVDFILHICLRLKELLGEGRAYRAGIVETMRGVGTSLVICAVTTAAGFYAFIPTSFDGVSELGLISGTGMFISLLASVTLLPALLVLVERFWSVPAGAASARLLPDWRPVKPPAKGVVAAAGVIAVASAVSLPGVTFDSNPIHLRDPQSESILALEDLAADSQAPLFDMVALADDAATASRWAAALEAVPEVERVTTFDSIVPADQTEKLLVLEDLALVMGPAFGAPEVEPQTAREQVAALESLAATLADLEAPTEAELELRAAVERWLEAAAGMNREELEASTAALDADLRGDLAAELGRLARGFEAEPIDRTDLPDDLAERWIGSGGRELVEIVPAENVNDNETARRFVTAVRAVIPNATGLPVVYQEASATVVGAFERALLYAFVLVVALLLVFLRSFKDTVLILAPILFAAVATAGTTVWLGLPLNFANIIALPLLVGVGVDSGIHMVHRMRTEPPRSGAAMSTSTSNAVLASGLTTIASFGNLAFSPHVGMASMGQLLTIGMGVTMLATLVLLPALFRLAAR